MYHSTTNSIDSKNIIENQSLVLKQQKKTILDLLNELDNLTKTNQ